MTSLVQDASRSWRKVIPGIIDILDETYLDKIPEAT